MPLKAKHHVGGVNLVVNYPDDSCEAAVPERASLDELFFFLRKLFDTEPEMTSFVLTAVRRKA